MVPQPRGRSQRQLNTQGLSGGCPKTKGNMATFSFCKDGSSFSKNRLHREAGVDGRSQMADCYVRVMMVAGPGRSHSPSESRVGDKGMTPGTCRSKTETGLGKKLGGWAAPETPAAPEATMLPLLKGLSPPCQYILGFPWILLQCPPL